jgi:hypothetical protein
MDLRLLGRALGLFAVLDPTHLPSHFIQVFLVIARDGPCTLKHIEDQLSLSNSAWWLPQKWQACQKLYDNRPAQIFCFGSK